jgi:hypothetical protein
MSEELTEDEGICLRATVFILSELWGKRIPNTLEVSEKVKALLKIPGGKRYLEYLARELEKPLAAAKRGHKRKAACLLAELFCILDQALDAPRPLEIYVFQRGKKTYRVLKWPNGEEGKMPPPLGEARRGASV